MDVESKFHYMDPCSGEGSSSYIHIAIDGFLLLLFTGLVFATMDFYLGGKLGTSKVISRIKFSILYYGASAVILAAKYLADDTVSKALNGITSSPEIADGNLGKAQLVTDKCLKIKYLYNGSIHDVYMPYRKANIHRDVNVRVTISDSTTIKQQPGVPYLISPDDIMADHVTITDEENERSITVKGESVISLDMLGDETSDR